METIKQLPSFFAFVKVAQFSSFSKAAEQIGVSKSHLSKLIKELEKQVQQTLFVRTTRSVELTEYGQYFFKMCKEHLFEIERITQQTQKLSDIPKGQLRITVAGAYGEETVAPLVAKLLVRYPDIKTELIFSEKILDLKKEKIDLAIRVSATKPKDGKAFKIGERKEFICASEGFLRKHGLPLKPKDLKNFNCLLGSQDTWVLKNKTRTYQVKVDGNFKSSSGRSLAQAALSNLGIVKLPEVYLRSLLNEKKLIPILSDFMTKPVPIWAVVPFEKEASELLALAIEELTTFTRS